VLADRAALSLAVTEASEPGAIAAFVRAVQPFGIAGARNRQRPTTPRRSPRITRFATIDGARIAIEYGQPGQRGREIWGGLVTRRLGPSH
jgi:hypothetical protein